MRYNLSYLFIYHILKDNKLLCMKPLKCRVRYNILFEIISECSNLMFDSNNVIKKVRN